MDPAFWQSIIDADYPVPAGYSAASLTADLTANLGALDPAVREGPSHDILETWVHRGHYSPAELRALLAQMAHNLTIGLGEQGADSVFLRTFSILIMNEILEEDNLRPFLEEAKVRHWMERALAYLAAERDLRGYIPGKGWAHSVAHTADTLWVLTRSRYLGASDLGRLLDAIADKIIDPVDHVYLYHEDERLAYAVMSALRRDLLDLPFLTAWLDRMVHPAGRSPWRQSFATPADASACHNTTMFLRSVYFQLSLGISVPSWHPNPAYFKRTPAVAADLLPELVKALRMIAPEFYAQPS